MPAPDDSTAALDTARHHDERIDLLLTDVVMPHLLGTALAGQVTAMYPETKVLFISGYATPVLAAHGTIGPDVTLLERPFTRTHLIAAVHEAMHGDSPEATSRR
ncbi:hypothetical protein Q0Z83_039660 [Actinoplanes sichuanensis]|nr:hypothetical protein Q0Z83_039660 [Actinoplanes sichuanensis]